MLMFKLLIAGGVVAALAGCVGSLQQSSKQEQKLSTPASTAPVTSVQPKDAAPAVEYVVQLDVYQLTVPFGSVSNNAAFWKRVSEDMMDVAVRDVLYLNGFRVGEAPVSEWEYFKNIIDENPAVANHQSYVAMDAKPVEMAMKKEVLSQCLFVMHLPPVEPNGKTFDACENVMMLSFRPAPRKQGDVRVKLCPMVRGLHKKMESTLLNREREISFVSTERLYDLRLEVDVPLDTFLVVAPSEYAKAPMSVGNAFMLKDGDTELQEQVLIFVPHVYSGRTVAANTPAGK